MYPLHDDMKLDDAARARVRDYLRSTGFGIAGTSPEDYRVLPKARYLGWHFAKEDLDAYAVGLLCTKPGFERRHTFIRMSYQQLVGAENPKVLPVNQPVVASDALRMRRWRDTPVGPSRTGVDSYAASDGSAPGADLDLTMLADTLQDALDAAAAGTGTDSDEQRDLAIDFGTLLAGRYPRLKALRQRGALSADQERRLEEFEQRFIDATDTLRRLELPTYQDVSLPEHRRHAAHNDF